KNLSRENSFESNPAGRPASGRRRRLSARRHRDGGNSLRWTYALQPRPWNFRWRALGHWDDRANGSAELRGLPRKVRARNQGSGVCAPHRIARAGEHRYYAISARRYFVKSAALSALRSRWRARLQSGQG